MSRKISNVGVLDLRTATEQSVAEIEKIGNIGMLLFTPQTAHLVSRLNIGNLGGSFEVSENAKFVQGVMQITRSFVETSAEPTSILVTGQLIIDEDVTAQDIERTIEDLYIMGQLICPETLASVIRSKLKNITGQTIFYPSGVRFIKGSVQINDAFLKSIEQPSGFYVLGKVAWLEPADTDRFSRYVESMEVSGKVLIREEYYEAFSCKLKSSSACKVEIIPAGFIYLPNRLNLDETAVRQFKNARLYCKDDVVVMDDVSESDLKKHISEIRCKSKIFCPKNLVDAVRLLCPDPAVPVLIYMGKILWIDGDYELGGPELEYAEKPLALVVTGSLELEDDLAADLIVQKIESVDNYGEITGSKVQIGALKSKIRSNKGEFSVKRESASPPAEGISNVGYLKL